MSSDNNNGNVIRVGERLRGSAKTLRRTLKEEKEDAVMVQTTTGFGHGWGQPVPERC